MSSYLDPEIQIRKIIGGRWQVAGAGMGILDNYPAANSEA
jgi:hypothetical protein